MEQKRERKRSFLVEEKWLTAQTIWKPTVFVTVGFPTPPVQSSQTRGLLGLEVRRKDGGQLRSAKMSIGPGGKRHFILCPT